MNIKLEDLQKAIIAGGTKWELQNNEQDRKTKFIYDVTDFDTLKLLCNTVLSKDEDRKYAYHRWVNFQSSIYCEQLFCKYGAKKVENRKDKNKDIYIKDIPYDVKLTTYPLSSEIKYNLETEDGIEGLIRWLYNNQSNEGRFHFKNRIFIVCSGETKEEQLNNKIRFLSIEEAIKKWMTTRFFEDSIFRKGWNRV